jgi:bacterioferritin-associated ferredoxin
MYICICNAVTEGQVRQCARDGAKCVEQLAGALGVGAGCGRCRETAAAILANMGQEASWSETSKSSST